MGNLKIIFNWYLIVIKYIECREIRPQDIISGLQEK